MFNEVQDRAVNIVEIRRYRRNETSGRLGQVKIGEARISEREFVFVDGESEATLFPGKYKETTKMNCSTLLAIRFEIIVS